MNFSLEIKTKKFKQTLLIFAVLFIFCFSFLVLAKENSSSSQNIFLDSDQDGLSDEEELSYGTDPQDRDTDNDGYSDGVEVKSGYDPLIPSPGDKIVNSITSNKSFSASNTSEGQENLTEKLSQQILNLANSESESGEIDMDKIQELISSTLNSSESAEQENQEDLISEDDIKIKEQNYSGFSEKKRQQKLKEDALEYLSGVFYIMASNSPEPITSDTDLASSLDSIFQEITQAFTSRSDKDTQALKESGEAMLGQIMEIEVPEDMLEIHVSALSFAKSAIQMESYVPQNSEDPIADIQNLSSISGLVTNLISFSSQVEDKLSEYDLTQSDVIDRASSLGL